MIVATINGARLEILMKLGFWAYTEISFINTGHKGDDTVILIRWQLHRYGNIGDPGIWNQGYSVASGYLDKIL